LIFGVPGPSVALMPSGLPVDALGAVVGGVAVLSDDDGEEDCEASPVKKADKKPKGKKG